LLALVVLALLPPLINVNRFQRRVASGISASLGRPVHLDAIHISLLPLPGFTLENFIVGEDPRFGSEPVMHANNVRATLRVSSLWRGHLEFSTISLEEPSVNLVRNAEGRWNLESILLQASQMEAAPTQQRRAGPAPRFPYIEATDARVNVKLGEEKLPFSLTSAEFALWLPDPQEWKLRLKAHPARTDTDASDTGELRVEATLRRATHMKDVPVQAELSWRKIPLGEASKVLLGYDAGWRGAAAAQITVDGTLGDASITSELHLLDVRRADFVPERQMEIDAHCEARATGLLHQLRGLRCSIPADASSVRKTNTQPQVQTVPAGTLSLTGDVGSVLDWHTADLSVSMAGIAPGYGLDWLRLFSSRVPRELRAVGELHGTFSHGPGTAEEWAGRAFCDCALEMPDKTGSISALPMRIDAMVGSDGTGGRWVQLVMTPPTTGDISAIPSAKGVEQLRGAAADGSLNGEGFRVHYPAGRSADFLPELARRIPPLLDELPGKSDGADITSYRSWNGAQSWSVDALSPKATKKRKR
jgi:AsmA protein